MTSTAFIHQAKDAQRGFAEVASAICRVSPLSDSLEDRKENGHQDTNDRDYGQEFDSGKSEDGLFRVLDDGCMKGSMCEGIKLHVGWVNGVYLEATS